MENAYKLLKLMDKTLRRHFSKLDKFKSKLNFNQGKTNQPDINQQIQSLNEANVQITFKDIYLDY